MFRPASAEISLAAPGQLSLPAVAESFGLNSDPFSLSPDPAFFYASPAHAEALAGLRLALASRRGLTTLIGEVGTGKTTLLYALLADLEPTVHTAYLANTKLSFTELLRQALTDFGVPSAARGRLELLHALQDFLRRCDAEGAIAALVIDEAQNLSADTFEHLRLLTNFETYSAKLLQIVLVGQPELAQTLARPELRQVNERIACRCTLAPLSRAEARRYLAHRLAVAGGSAALLTPAARALLIGAARGLPRRLNVLAHTALLFAFGRGALRVGAGDVWAALRERRRARAPRRVGAAPRRLGWAAAAAGLAALALWSVSERRAVSAEPLDAAPAPAHVLAAPPQSEPAPLAAAPAPVVEAPRPLAPPVAPATEALVVVGRGQTATDIARRFYGNARPETLRHLRAANPQLKDLDRITAGDTLRVPAGATGGHG